MIYVVINPFKAAFQSETQQSRFFLIPKLFCYPGMCKLVGGLLVNWNIPTINL